MTKYLNAIKHIEFDENAVYAFGYAVNMWIEFSDESLVYASQANTVLRLLCEMPDCLDVESFTPEAIAKAMVAYRVDEGGEEDKSQNEIFTEYLLTNADMLELLDMPFILLLDADRDIVEPGSIAFNALDTWYEQQSQADSDPDLVATDLATQPKPATKRQLLGRVIVRNRLMVRNLEFGLKAEADAGIPDESDFKQLVQGRLLRIRRAGYELFKLTGISISEIDQSDDPDLVDPDPDKAIKL